MVFLSFLLLLPSKIWRFQNFPHNKIVPCKRIKGDILAMPCGSICQKNLTGHNYFFISIVGYDFWEFSMQIYCNFFFCKGHLRLIHRIYFQIKLSIERGVSSSPLPPKKRIISEFTEEPVFKGGANSQQWRIWIRVRYLKAKCSTKLRTNVYWNCTLISCTYTINSVNLHHIIMQTLFKTTPLIMMSCSRITML